MSTDILVSTIFNEKTLGFRTVLVRHFITLLFSIFLLESNYTISSASSLFHFLPFLSIMILITNDVLIYSNT